GSTGSIGKSALDVVRQSPGKFRILGLSANRDTKTLYKQIKEFSPKYVCVRDEKAAKAIKPDLDKICKLFKGDKGLEEFSNLKSDISIMAISGISALKPLLVNIRYAKRIALANKESLVTAGKLIFNEAKRFNTEIIPVDSEINALFQLVSANREDKKTNNSFRKIYLTASGGSLAGYKKKDLDKVSVKQVLNHPTWKMGRRITVDSATLMNKGFEVIESHYFFNIPYDKINIVIHKESVVHALVEYKDDTLFSCMYSPDMRMPISFALYYPERFDSDKKKSVISKGTAFLKNKNGFLCSFYPVNYSKYPILEIILQSAKKQDNSLIILNACDEIAIDYFLKKKIKFTDIYRVIKFMFNRYPAAKITDINDIFYWDNWGRIKTREYLNKL
ncbi:MAG: 1-deoxy-D-xylulose-5-phosphate reductoisomerase, partial [Candidatus Omnitrophica bacterium]|nr:1-deoxy-D-xylulose-5-phosphate reductoisomerase [Candidatus Omnitrophota bacterium]